MNMSVTMLHESNASGYGEKDRDDIAGVRVDEARASLACTSRESLARSSSCQPSTRPGSDTLTAQLSVTCPTRVTPVGLGRTAARRGEEGGFGELGWLWTDPRWLLNTPSHHPLSS